MRVAVVIDDAHRCLTPCRTCSKSSTSGMGGRTGGTGPRPKSLPILEPAPLPEDFDPLFLPDSSEFEDLPDGLEAFVAHRARVHSNLNADVTEGMLSTNAAGASNDQSPSPAATRSGDIRRTEPRLW